MNKICSFAAAAVLLLSIPASVYADSRIDMDYNSDGMYKYISGMFNFDTDEDDSEEEEVNE